jgi:hypothetical protein
VDEDVAVMTRLFALRALAAPDSSGGPIRPSRIEARTFLEFLHRRDSLGPAGLSLLLQVSRAFGFHEEVRLLSGELQRHLDAARQPALSGFHENSLVYLGLEAGRESASTRESVLQATFSCLDEEGLKRGWEPFAGFLNLLAVFLWEGDFMLEGNARIAFNDGEPVLIPSGQGGLAGKPIVPDLPEAAGEGGILSLEVDASECANPVMILALGMKKASSPPPPYPEQEQSAFREYLEPTLLAGIRRQVDPLGEELLLQPGDTLQVRLSIYVEEPAELAEFQFSCPAGATLAADAIQHLFEPSTGKALFGPPAVTFVEQPDRLKQVIRMKSLASGRHEFILSYRVNWAGTFEFPPHRLVIPRTGTVYRIGEARMLRVEPNPD